VIVDLVNALVVFANFALIPAIAYGSQLTLGALGVTLIYGVLRFSNFAHGDTMAFGAMVAVLLTWALQAAGVSIAPLPTALLALPLAVVATIGLVLLTDRAVYRFYRRRKAAPVVLVMVSIGVMFVMNGLVRFVIGVGDRNLADGARFVLTVADFRRITGLDEGLAIRTSQVITLVTAMVLVAALFWFLSRTRAGKAMRAFSDNEDLALLSGIRVNNVKLWVFVLCGALCGLAGLLQSARTMAATAQLAQGLELDVIAAVVVGGTPLTGGIGRIRGTVLGVLIIAILSNGMNMTGVDPYLQNILKGLVLIIAVFLTIDRSKILIIK
jgi:branched-chain amino acid transport system permease protein